MADSVTIPQSISARASDRTYAVAQTAAIPWYVWCAVVAVTSAMIGGQWDISWHRSIGRDTFWTPAHVAIYLCGVLAGLSCGYLILITTFSRNPALKRASVEIWGFRAPLGAFICAWGGIAMLTSAPFDNWWHNAYGLDVKIISPPHIVLALGLVSIELGSLILVLGKRNCVEGKLRRNLTWIFFYIGGMIVTALVSVFMAYTFRTLMHSAIFYTVIALSVPIVLAAVSRASGHRWACTLVVAVYTLFMLGLQWILSLFRATPKLGPVYQHVTHFIPAGFPLLLIAPAVALDLLWRRVQGWSEWAQAALAGCVFLGIFVAAQWPFADFLMTPASRNWFFGSHYFDYLTPPTSYSFRNLYYPFEGSAPEFWKGMAEALALAIATTRIGAAWGNWMRVVRR